MTRNMMMQFHTILQEVLQQMEKNTKMSMLKGLF